MGTVQYWKINSSSSTDSSSVTGGMRDEHGDKVARVDLRLPSDFYIGVQNLRGVKDIKVQLSQVKLSLDMVPIASIPIESIIITVNGLNLSRQIQPVNISQVQGSSLTTTIPIIEKFFVTRDMQGDFIYSHETFDDCSLASISVKDLHERNITFDAWYICSDGTMHRVIIGDTGIFSIQLTLGIYF